ncbi:MAG: choice-of-anchor L domain-containing protein [Saprospiraceae bacterium]|nr:choice-of-anchor L domain-containing protein [Saprospiraceae bacterium]
MSLFTSRSVFLVGLLAAFCLPLAAQQTSPILDAQKRRHVVTAESAQQTIVFQNMIPNETYGLLVPGSEPCLAQCMPDISVLTPNTQIVSYNAAIKLLKFVASASVMEFRLDYPCTWDPSDPPRHYVSMMRVGEKKKVQQALDMAVLEVGGGSAEDLIKDVFIGGNCFDVTGITYSGQGDQIGSFSNGLTNVGFDQGVIMATGGITVAPGPNDSDGASAGYGIGTPDGDLQSLTPGALFDMANIEFDFTPTQTPLTFEFVFASEEYCEYVNTGFNDVFGFFISGPGIAGTQNLAVVPSTAIPITINTINHQTNSGFYTHNTPATGDNCGTIPPAAGPAVLELQYDGYTRKMVAVANVIPCSTYHIKLKIADVGDGVWDSAVFLKSGSFDGGGNASIDWLVNGEPDVDEVTEGCGLVQLLIDRVGSNPNLPLPVSFTITGTATQGADYGPISSTYVIPAGQDQLLIPVNIVNDLIPEGAETVILTLNNACSCLNPQETLTILDYEPMTPVADTVVICGPGVATVGVNVEGGVGPYTYSWNTGGTDPTITPFVGSPTTYTVTVTDACGRTSTARARVNINQPPIAQLLGPNTQICPGQEATLMINFTGNGPFDITYNFNNDPQTPITGITDDPFALIITEPGSYQLTTVLDGSGCPGSANGTVVVIPSSLQLSGVPSTLACSGASNGSINTTVTGGQGPYNYLWIGSVPIGNIPDPNGLPAGTYQVTVTDGFGCTNNQSFTITAPPAIAPSIVNVQGVNCFSPNGGSINLNVTGGTPNYTYAWSNGATVQDPINLTAGNYSVIITDANNCTMTSSAVVPSDFAAPTAVTSPPSSITCSVPAVSLDGTGSSSGGNFSYNWTANPGNIVSGNNTLNPVVNQAGTYVLVVQNLTNGCTSSASSTVSANNTPPVAAAGPDETLTCAATNVTLDGSGSSNGGQYTYMWTASNGGVIIGGETTPNPIVSETGTYTLVVTNTQNGCTSTDIALVDEDLTPPNASVAPPALITCTVSQVTLNGSASTPAGISYMWTTTNGFIVSGHNSPTAVVNEAGQYTLIVTSPTNGCTSTQEVTVNQNFSAPIAVATSSNDITCINLQATVSAVSSQMQPTDSFVWSTLDGNFVSGTNTLTPVVNEPGTYSIVITNPTSMCTSQASIVVAADNLPPAANAGPPATLTCAVTTALLGDPLAPTGPNLSYAWTASNGGNIVSGGDTPMPTIDNPGTYNLLVTNSTNGCTNTASIIVNENITPPAAVVAPGGEINCTTPAIQLSGSGSSTGPTYSYQWTSASGSGIGAGDNTLTPTIIAPGTYTLVVTNAANGCTNSASTNVTINANVPTALATPIGLLTCSFQAIEVNANGSTTGPTINYQWGTVDGQIQSGNGTPVILVSEPGTYTLVVTNTANNCTASTTVDVQQNIDAPVAEAGPGNVLNCTVPSMMLFGDSSSVGAQFAYNWTAISGGNFVSQTNILNPQVNEAGVYQLLVTNITNGCTAVDQVEILADDNDPVVALSQPAELNCLTPQTNISSAGSSTGANFTYSWTGPGLQSNPNALDATINQPGNYTLVITNTDNGCTSEQTVPATQDIQAPPADAGPDVLLNCYNPQLQIGGTNNPVGPNFTYNWIDPGGIVSGWNTVNPVVAGGGTYIIIVTNTDNGCTSTDPMDVTTDFEAPQANAGPSFQLSCTQPTYTLQAIAPVGPNFEYQWTTNGGNFLSATNILNPTVDGAGEYFLLVTNTANGCTSSPTVQITQAADVPLAVANDAADLTCAVTQLNLDGAGSNSGVGYSVQWTASNGGNIVSGGNTLNPLIDQPGTYTLTVQNLVNQCTANSSVIVEQNIVPPPVDAGPQQTLTCAVLSLNLQGSNSASGNFTYEWVTPDGNIVNGANSLTPTIDATGYYELTATNLDNGCVNTVSVNVIANQVDPVAAIDQPETLTCTVDEVTLDAGGSTTGDMAYVWTTTNGNISNQSDPLAVVVNQPGDYTLLVTDNVNGCTHSATVNVPQDIADPTAEAGANGLLTCAITSISLDGTGSSANGNFFYQWTTTNGNILVGANSLTPMVIAGGTYTLIVTNNDNGCSASDQVIVNTDTQAPLVAIASPGVIGCTQPSVVLNGSGSTGGPNIQYEWITADGNILSGGSSNTATVNSAGQYILNVLNTSNGCSASQSVQVSDNIVLPLAEAGPGFTLTCNVTQTALQGSGSTGNIYSYAWTTQNGNIVSGANTLQPVVNEPGAYSLLVTNTTTGCTQTDNVEIIVETNVPTDFVYELVKPTCKDNDGLITFGQVDGGYGPYSYSIDGGDTYNQTIDFANITPGTYALMIQDANGCEFEQPLTVPQAPDPAINADPLFEIQLGDEQELNAVLGPAYPVSLIESITWTPSDDLTFENNCNCVLDQLNPTARPLRTTEYTVTIVSTDGCQATDRVLIRVDNRPHIYIPNVFYPNTDDGLNNFFLIFADGDQIEKVDKFQIFDRWGNMVFTDQNFQPNDPTHGWDGTFKGELMNPAVFVYYAEIRLIDGRVLLFKGDVTLVD